MIMMRILCFVIRAVARIPKLRRIFYRIFLDFDFKSLERFRWHYWAVQMKFLGKTARISYKVKITAAENISIGERTHITNNVILNGRGGIIIGNDVLVGYQTIIMTSMRNYSDPNVPIRLQGSQLKPVCIGNDVWIAARVMILPGVTVGEGSVIGSGAVVTKDIPEYTVVAGVLAKVIGRRGEDQKHE